jgi:hypothetical protein
MGNTFGFWGLASRRLQLYALFLFWLFPLSLSLSLFLVYHAGVCWLLSELSRWRKISTTTTYFDLYSSQ